MGFDFYSMIAHIGSRIKFVEPHGTTCQYESDRNSGSSSKLYFFTTNLKSETDDPWSFQQTLLQNPKIEPTHNYQASSDRPRLYAILFLALLVAMSVYGHLRLSADSTHYTGVPLVLDHLYNLVIAGTMFAILFATG